MLHLYHDRDIKFQYKVILKTSTRHLYIRIKDGKVTVTANKQVTSSYIAEFIESKADWIHSHLSRSPNASLLTDPDAMIYLLGEHYSVQIHHTPYDTEESMVIEGSIANFTVNSEATHKKLQILRDRYYKKLSEQYITPMVERFSNILDLYPAEITYRSNKSRWGSCSNQNRLSLNTRLMMLPEPMIAYVIIHELVHIKHKNHSKSFWNEVERYCPSYKDLRQDIRAFENYF